MLHGCCGTAPHISDRLPRGWKRFPPAGEFSRRAPADRRARDVEREPRGDAGAGQSVATDPRAGRSVITRPPTAVRTVLVWGAFALLGLYSAGNIVELTGIGGVDPGGIDMRSLAYIVFFLAGATGYGEVAVSDPHPLYSQLRRIALVTSEA